MAWTFFANQAQPEDQGSFCDTNSGIHYQSMSKDDALDKAALDTEQGASTDVRYDYNVDSPNNLPGETRFNTTILETDDQGFYYPAKHGPRKE